MESLHLTFPNKAEHLMTLTKLHEKLCKYTIALYFFFFLYSWETSVTGNESEELVISHSKDELERISVNESWKLQKISLTRFKRNRMEEKRRKIRKDKAFRNALMTCCCLKVWFIS